MSPGGFPTPPRTGASVILTSDRPKSGSVGRVGPESILSRFWVGRSENVDPKPPETAQNRLKPPKNSRSDPKFLRRAPRSGSVGRDRPTQNHSKWRPLGRSVGYADYNFYFASPNRNRQGAGSFPHAPDVLHTHAGQDPTRRRRCRQRRCASVMRARERRALDGELTSSARRYLKGAATNDRALQGQQPARRAALSSGCDNA